MTDLQMQGYLLIRDFRRRINRRANPTAGQSPSTPPRSRSGGYEHISSAYSTPASESKALIFHQVRNHFPEASEPELEAVLD